MLKILHAADLHLDSALSGRNEAATTRLRGALRSVPEKIVAICRRESCDLLFLAGDVFDGVPTAETLLQLKQTLEEGQIPVFITPGNHDFCTPSSPWQKELWPENVHIFTKPAVESVVLPQLNCRVYGAGFAAMDCDPLLEHFHPEGTEAYQIGIFHGDPLQPNSPYNPISQAQVAASQLQYLALGHIHKTGSFRAGRTLCAWPGCPMGRGFDELEEKGVLLVTVEDTADARFIALDLPRFYEREVTVRTTAQEAVASVLPAVGNEDFYRITLTGASEPLDVHGLAAGFGAFPNLQLRDKTHRPVDLWGSAGEDSLEGVYFAMLRKTAQGEDAQTALLALLAAEISRTILDGGEVVLP